MINLQEYIKESLLDDEDEIFANVEQSIKSSISKFIEDNFNGASKCKISEEPNADGKYVVDCPSPISVKKKSLTSLTNDKFVWGKVSRSFNCGGCYSLKTLEGAPKFVEGDFGCYNCDNLTSLEGAPEKVGGNFSCSHCDSLTSLEGAPKEVRGHFYCYECNSLTSLKGAPKEVRGHFYCYECNSLTSLKGAPEKVEGNFSCKNCHSLKSYKVDSNIKGRFIK
jgi:hypothetical protein